MGLDNGISIIRYNNETFKKFPETWIHIYGEEDKTVYVEPVYMRKWWGVRNDIVNYLNLKYKTSHMNDGRWELTSADLRSFIDIYIDWLDEDKWRSESDSIWDWEEANIAGQIALFIVNLKKLINLMSEYSDIIVEFYDSY